jgi:hypothetical protein
MATRKRPTFSFPELEGRGRQAILRTPEEIRAEQELMDNEGSEVPSPTEAEDQSTSPQVHKWASGQVGKTTSQLADKPAKPLVHKYTTHLRPETIKAVKRAAFESERKDYEIVQEALDAYLGRLDKP